MSTANKNTMHDLQDGNKEDAKEDAKEGAKKGAKDGSKDVARVAQDMRPRNTAL